MNCLIVSDQIRVQMDNRDMAVSADEVTGRGMPTPGASALQRPDMNRMRLAAMLRRSGTRSNIDGARLTWNVMLNRCVAECANSNG
ncbi:MAG: hypothetical protein JWO78_2001 [Micavibrio sp.]|nr:hypothetical protein [Micavibrio sp.]